MSVFTKPHTDANDEQNDAHSSTNPSTPMPPGLLCVLSQRPDAFGPAAPVPRRRAERTGMSAGRRIAAHFNKFAAVVTTRMAAITPNDALVRICGTWLFCR